VKATDIPFVRHIGIAEEQTEASLEYDDHVMNHIGTIHAGAQFALAETRSGICLQVLFPELEGKVVPVLRDAKIKYRKPAAEKIVAYASVEKEALETFREQFAKKGRSLL
jgi:uncharacterized protein (TIGR00369 family)